MIPSIKIEDYSYDLPDERIAKYPLPERDSSKLLVYEDGHVSDHVFRDIPSLLPEGSIMVFNNTKVVPARSFRIVKISHQRKPETLSALWT